MLTSGEPSSNNLKQTIFINMLNNLTFLSSNLSTNYSINNFFNLRLDNYPYLDLI